MNVMPEKSDNIVYISVSKSNYGQRFKAMRMASSRKLIPVYPNIVADFAQFNPNKERDKDARDKERWVQIKKASEVWVIGEINREMTEDIDLAKRLAKKIHYFETTPSDADLKEIDAANAKKGRLL
jgi:hypothetical protein